jgi:hypothetical protein
MRGRYDNLKRILQLDPLRDHQQIVQIVGSYEYPWMMQKSLEFALFRTYAVPSIGALLDTTRQFARHGQKRYDDTSLLIAEFVEHGYDSERGRRAIRRMNALHGRYAISNDDFLYVLGTFIFTPIDWHRKFGWRQPTDHESLANYYFWVEVGKRMAIRDIPESYEAYERFFRDYERQHFRYTPESRRVADATIEVFLSWYPRPLHGLIREVIYALMDEPLREAFGYPKPSGALKALVEGSLKLMALWIRYAMPPRRQPYRLTALPNRTYRQGYQIDKLGS